MKGVIGAERVTAIFGRWPSFHDAEVMSLSFERTEDGFDVLAAIHTWESTGEVDERGYYRLHKHTRVSFRFGDCDEDRTQLGGFDGQNVIFGLKIFADGASFVTEFEPCYGVHGTLVSKRVEVVDVRPYDLG